MRAGLYVGGYMLLLLVAAGAWAEAEQPLPSDALRHLRALDIRQARETLEALTAADSGELALAEKEVSTRSQLEAMHGKLAEIVIPRISFEEATMEAVVAFLRQQSRERDPEGRGVNTFIWPGPYTYERAVGSGQSEEESAGEAFEFDWDLGDDPDLPDTGSRWAAQPLVSITVDVENLSLGEVIGRICRGADWRYQVTPHAVIIGPPGVLLEPLEIGTFELDPGFMKVKLGSGSDEGGAEDGAVERLDPKAFFARVGVDWPEGSGAVYSEPQSLLVVHNTPSELRMIEMILAGGGWPTTLVQTTLDVVASRQPIDVMDWREAKWTRMTAIGTVSSSGMQATARSQRGDALKTTGTAGADGRQLELAYELDLQTPAGLQRFEGEIVLPDGATVAVPAGLHDGQHWYLLVSGRLLDAGQPLRPLSR